VIEFPSAYAPDANGYFQKGLATRDAYEGEALLSFTFAPHAPYTVGDESLKRVAVLAEELDVPIHTHVHETRAEIEQGLKEHGVRPLERLRRLGLVGPRLIAVHAVHLEDAELDLMAREGVSIAHCPSSNLKLASGIANVAGARQRGVRVGLGTDGAASNNRLDPWTEMRTAALLAKAPRRRSRWPRSRAPAPSGSSTRSAPSRPERRRISSPSTSLRSRRCRASIRSPTSSMRRAAST
jgi:5-methylthioadenosine/S-adenosylhomocysteine deaminase